MTEKVKKINMIGVPILMIGILISQFIGFATSNSEMLVYALNKDENIAISMKSSKSAVLKVKEDTEESEPTIAILFKIVGGFALFVWVSSFIIYILFEIYYEE